MLSSCHCVCAEVFVRKRRIISLLNSAVMYLTKIFEVGRVFIYMLNSCRHVRDEVLGHRWTID